MQPALAHTVVTCCALMSIVLLSAVPVSTADPSPVVAWPFAEQTSHLWLAGEAVTEGYRLSLEYEPVEADAHRAILIHAQPSGKLLLVHWNGEPAPLDGETPRAVTSEPFGHSFPRVTVAEPPPTSDDTVTATLLTVDGQRRLLTAARVGSLDRFEIETRAAAGLPSTVEAPETRADD